MQSQLTVSTRSYSELGLPDLVRAVGRYRMVVASTVAIAMLVSAAVAFLTPPVYESRATVQIGHWALVPTFAQWTPMILPLEPPETVAERLKERYHVDMPDESGLGMPRLESVSLNRSAKNLIVLRARALGPEEAHDFLAKVVGEVLEEHHREMVAFNGVLQRQAEEIGSRIAQVQSQLSSYASRSSARSPNRVDIDAILVLERGALLERMSRLEETRLQILRQLTAASPTELIDGPTIPEHRVSPRRSLVLGAGTLIGMFAGTFVAVILQRSNRRAN
ncbi:MAG: Wzz/FepE/Etk N-terminal domain-containing protein [Sulfurifustis sp.]